MLAKVPQPDTKMNDKREDKQKGKQASEQEGKQEKQPQFANQTRRPRQRKKKARKEKPDSLRCFFGLAFPLHEALGSLQQNLQELSVAGTAGLRIAPAANLHVTLKFLGSIKQQQLSELELLASSICTKASTLKLQCRGTGLFKNSLWVGIEQDEALRKLAANFDLAAQGVGIARELRDYQPHVTVARFRPGARDSLKPLLEKYSDKHWGEFECREVHLYLSETLQEGARYSILRSFSLQGESEADKND
jgi:2'-5' RNA ligase